MGYNPVSNDGISNPGVSPIEPSPSVGPGKPGLGAGEEVQGRPFTLNPSGNPSESPASTKHPSPMSIAEDAARQQRPMAPEEIGANLDKLSSELKRTQSKLQDPEFTKTLSEDHFVAMHRLSQKMTPDMQTIAKYSKGQYSEVQQEKGQSAVDYISQWIDSGQQTLQGALAFLQTDQKPNPGDYLRLQYAVQRGAQRGELFASIIGSTVSGIKNILSTQLS